MAMSMRGQGSLPVDRDGHSQEDGYADKEADKRGKFVYDFTRRFVVFGHNLEPILVERDVVKKRG